MVADCERPRTGGSDLCSNHQGQWAAESERGVGKAAFVTAAHGLDGGSDRGRSSAGSVLDGPRRTATCAYASGI